MKRGKAEGWGHNGNNGIFAFDNIFGFVVIYHFTFMSIFLSVYRFKLVAHIHVFGGEGVLDQPFCFLWVAE